MKMTGFETGSLAYLAHLPGRDSDVVKNLFRDASCRAKNVGRAMIEMLLGEKLTVRSKAAIRCALAIVEFQRGHQLAAELEKKYRLKLSGTKPGAKKKRVLRVFNFTLHEESLLFGVLGRFFPICDILAKEEPRMLDHLSKFSRSVAVTILEMKAGKKLTTKSKCAIGMALSVIHNFHGDKVAKPLAVKYHPGWLEKK